MRPVIDMHQHLSKENTVETLADVYSSLGVEKAVLLGLPPRREPGNNEAVLQAARKKPELFIPFFGFDLDEMTPDDLSRAKDAGFVGAKFIGPRKPYNDFSYFPVYERAAELGMPVVFHLGIVANTGRWRDCDCSLMRPVFLDHIARTHPQLTIVGAHLGNPWYEEAAMSCRWNPNLFFDISGSTLKCKKPEFIGALLWWTACTAYRSPDGTAAWEKIVFGSDVRYTDVRDVMRDYEVLMSALNLSTDLQEKVWRGTAARVLGLGE
jgi:predicted TIM-barrel fold metal-dependent hydrolase